MTSTVTTYRSIAKPALQAVVSIYTSGKVEKKQGRKFSLGPFTFDVPGDGKPQRREALGSGVIVRNDGLVITNNHVIAKADKIKVVLVDGRAFDARVVVRDAHTDLAALRFIKTKKNAHMFRGGFPCLNVGRGDVCEVGDVVLAIGNNLGLQGTVTQGIISALGRFIPKQPGQGRSRGAPNAPDLASKIAVPLIQTSASINPGSSGGALVNMTGELVGINTMIVTPSGGNVGLAFAVPANYIAPVLRAVDAGRAGVRRPFIGCTLGRLPYPERGVLIHGVLKDGPAAHGGVQTKDVIFEVDGKRVEDSDRFLMMVSLRAIGDTIQLKVRRRRGKNDGPTANSQDGSLEVATCSVRVGAWKARLPELIKVTENDHPLQGVTFAEMGPVVNAQLGIKEASRKGVVVLRVDDGSPTAGFLLPGDQLVQIGPHPVRSVRDAKNAVGALGPGGALRKTAGPIKISVVRKNVQIEFTIRLRRSRL